MQQPVSAGGQWPGLAGRLALVTGASRGIGARFAACLAAAGARVALAAREPGSLEPVAAALREAGAETFMTRLDVRSRESIVEAVSAVEAGFGEIDVLVNNAGVTVHSPALEQSEADWDDVLDTNLKGPFLLATEVARRMRARGRGGSIVNVASVLGIGVAGAVAPYAASKAALVHLTRALALEWARYGIRVNAIAPGYFATDINRGFWETPAGEALVKRIPQRRLGRLEELDAPLLLLASDASSFMTGSVIVVDGGHLASSL